MSVLLKKLFDKMGFKGSTAPPIPHNALDVAAHMHVLAAYSASYWEKRAEEAKHSLLISLGGPAIAKIEETKGIVRNTQVPSIIMVGDTERLNIGAKIANGATYLDIEGLKATLKAEFGIGIEEVFKKHTQRRAPSMSFVITEKINGN